MFRKTNTAELLDIFHESIAHDGQACGQEVHRRWLLAQPVFKLDTSQIDEEPFRVLFPAGGRDFC